MTVAGLPYSHRADIDGQDALKAPLHRVYGLLLDRDTGRLLFHDEGLVERLEPDGTLLAVAGVGRQDDGNAADGTAASDVRFGILRGMAQDASGTIYVADAFPGRIFRLARDGTATTFGSAILNSPRGLAFDSRGNLYITDVLCHCIRRLDPSGVFSTLYTLPPSSTFSYFEGLAIDANGNLFVAEYTGHRLLKIGADGVVTTIAGTGIGGFSGDHGPATQAQLQSPSGIAVAADGTLYFTDTGNHRVRRVTPDGIISTVAGTGERGFSGDGGPASAARLNLPAQVLLDAAGNLYVSDYLNGRVRMVTPDGMIGTIAGSGETNRYSIPYPGIGDGGPAITALVTDAPSVTVDGAGNVYFAESGAHRVRKISLDGIITTFAGTGFPGYSGDGGPAAKAALLYPGSLAVDAQGSVYVTTADSRVRKIDSAGTITLVAGRGEGTGTVRFSGDGGPAIDAIMNGPAGVAVDAAGNVYITDSQNARLRRVDRNGIIDTVAGQGPAGVVFWNGVAIDPRGNVYVSVRVSQGSFFYSTVDRVNRDGSLTRIAGNQQRCTGPASEFASDGAQATDVPLCNVTSLTFDSQGFLYIPDSFYYTVLRMAPDGTISRVAGSLNAQEIGDGGPPGAASLHGSVFGPQGLSVGVDASGNLFIPQAGAGRLREVTAAPLALQLSQDRIELQAGQSQTIGVTTNFAEPLPYLVLTQAAWLSVNRVSGQTGEALRISVNTAGLVPGVYRGTVSVVLAVPNPVKVDVPVSLTVP